MTTDKPTAILLMGPTASGKTELSIAMAEALNAEVISVDSALVYQGMDIGTAKPGLEERRGIPHHLIDILDPSEAFSTGQFRSLALEWMADITRRGKLPLLVGGTMLYFSALTQGLARLPEADADIRQRLDRELLELGKEAMHARLARIDPQAAARIHINDPQRIQRALEVYEISGRPLSAFFQTDQQNEQPYRYLKLIIAPAERQTLHAKIAERFKLMLARGFVEEVQALRARGDLNDGMPSIRCVGYRQAWSYLNGEYDLETLQEKAIIATRQLAKRQFTWLRKEQNARHLLSEAPDLLETALRYYKQHG
ncbi:MAG: tRNA (adenosine(37)-N6)-dimethylallyltransferase MiaA [Methylomonas sp.]|jgi:tRNA dimethylallyltransferase|uniref:tRNA (adenosine(37)-N6)-dimethylallyltransferase MiaA n=1 Tax=Methylomonas sp. TaxID=418 RepID=UPI0025ED237B|nr:tRNA (adenosine(37)-N6)-dimethylallyltransferase MiaA [Methylomonas sp.]MCK9606823.1 tRNA (adenosine(37)-N6)-dimethylallyltransferase MiaA [Methylomonas sp.]